MPKFKNTSVRNLSLLHMGRKINIPPGAIVDGPDHFKIYRGLVEVEESQYEEFNKILPKVVKHNPSSPMRKFMKPSDGIHHSLENVKYAEMFEDESALPLNTDGLQIVTNIRNHISNYPKNGIHVVILLDGSHDEVHRFVTINSNKSFIKNIEYIWVSESEPVELKTIKESDIDNLTDRFIIRHKASLVYVDDYVSTFVKLLSISKFSTPKYVDIYELSSNHVKTILLEKYLKTKKVDVSIVTLTHNINQYNDFIEDISKQRTKFTYEIVCICNYNMEFSSCTEALNLGRELSDSDVVIMCHQDLRVNDIWIQGILKHVKYFESKKIPWGVLGMAGCFKTGRPNTPDSDGCILYLSDKLADGRTYAQAYRGLIGNRKEVQTVDELCLIVPKNAPFKFDEKLLDHFHWYGTDICLDALSKGYRNFAIDAECIHLSDGRSNLSGGHAEKFIEDARKIWFKWSSKFHYFRSTTATFMYNEKTIIFGIFILINHDNGNKNLPESIKMG
jgi:hypothetical protein